MIKAANTADFLKSVDTLRRSRQDSLPSWYQSLAAGSWEAFQQKGLPTVRDEDYKYTDLSALAQIPFVQAQYRPCSVSDLISRYVEPADITLVIINGHLSPEQSRLRGLPPGVAITELTGNAGVVEQLFTNKDQLTPRVFAQLNESLTLDGLVIDITPKARVEPLIHMIHITDSRPVPVMSLPRILLRIGEQAEASIMESHWSLGEGAVYCVNALTDIDVATGGRLNFCRAQNDSMEAYHFCNTRVRLGRDADFSAYMQNLGSKLTRNDLDVYFQAEGASADLNGLAYLHKGQHVDSQTFIDHAFPNGTSKQLYKNVLKDHSRGVFNGKILVHSIAQQTNAYQLNKNLLLGKDCRVDTKPQLEIFADDVKCSHGATIGQLNDDEIFYLRSRGLDQSQAEHMLAQGFVDDILSRVDNMSLRRKCEEMLCPVMLATQGEDLCR